jgi:hypothetical protein
MSGDSCGGWLVGWQAQVFAWGMPRCTISGPRHRSTNQLGRTVFCRRESVDSWASAWPSRPFWLHGNLVFLWPSWLDDTGAGGLIPQFVMTPTIRTHCLLRWDQTPVPTSESGRWLRTGGLLPLDTNKLDTPLGDCRCRGLLLQDTQSLDVRGSFYWTPTGWAHPRVATTFGGSFHWTLGHLT